MPLGIRVKDLSEELRQHSGSNKGVVVDLVVKGSPAYRADIMQNDILKRINGTDIYDAKSLSETTAAYAGQRVTIELLREDAPITKEIILNPKP
jgi:S1-C subfamily serine protease